MSTPDAGIESQLRNIEATYGKSRDEWYEIIRATGLTKHNDVVSLLKTEHGLKHGAAHRLSLTARASETGRPPSATDAVAELYGEKRAALRPIHEAVIAALVGFGGDFEQVPKRRYISLRRKKQFAMIQPSTATRVDLGLILPDVNPGPRLESAEKFNPLFTHRVRLESKGDIDKELVRWLRTAYDRAG